MASYSTFKHPTLRVTVQWDEGEYHYTKTGPAVCEYRNVQYNTDGSIDIEFKHPAHDWITHTATSDDVEKHGRELFRMAKAGELGPIAPAREK